MFGGGLRVTTTIDLALQEQARTAIDKVLPEPGRAGRRPRRASIRATGAVKAMFGGRNFRESQFNLAAQAERQPGSAFKPIVLATAMREGISPLTELESKKVSIDAGDRIWNGDELRPHVPRSRLRSPARWSPPTTRCTRS